ncbi:MAG: CRISPR-associated CARF protein Csa3 [Thermofilum sp.]|nr:CRISPR-associated CARF protein Csa3 [Thermofilum sp.]
MHGRSFVFSLGFHEDFVIRRLSSLAARKGEEIVLFTGSPVVPGTRRAYTSLLDYCTRVGLEAPRLVELPLSDAPQAVSTAVRVVSGLREPIVADLGGGMRAVVVAVLLALMTSGKAFELYVSSEGGEAEELRIPAGVARALSSLSAEKREILSVIARSEGCTAEFIAGRTGKALKTVRNHLSELKRMSLVASTGRRGGYKLTSWGRAVLGRYE